MPFRTDYPARAAGVAHAHIFDGAGARCQGKVGQPDDVFRSFVLIVLGVSAIAIWVFLAVAPGRIADQRGHRHADAVRVCGYWGALTLGLLMPLAFIWAYADGTSAPADRDAGNQA
ncbi:MAG: DUF3302 domain-containing protein [Pseudomonadota bacterium]